MVESIRDLVAASVEQKIRAGEELAAAVEAVRAADAELARLKSESARLRAAAIKAGWSERDLRRVGLTDESPRKRTRTAPHPAASAPTAPVSE